MVALSLSPVSVFRCAAAHRKLLTSLVRREVAARYRGSMFGLLWTVLLPMLMLTVYGTVFGVIMKNRWQPPPGHHEIPFILLMFAGMVIANIFCECLGRAPSLMMENPSYIKRVVFPLEIMPWVAIGSAALNAAPSFLILAVAYFIMVHTPPLTILLVPFVVVTLVPYALGAMWFLGALGVYLRDLRQVMGIAIMALQFLAPVYYPIDNFPRILRPWVYLNPLTLPLLEMRKAMFWGEMPDWKSLSVYFLLGWIVAWLGYLWHAKTCEGFADVV